MADPDEILEITILPTNTVIPVNPGETILGAMVRSGFLMRVGCKRGGCGICKVVVVSGETRDEKKIAANVLTDADRAVGVTLSCRAVPLTNLVVELQEGDKLRLMSPMLRDAARKAMLAKRAKRPRPSALASQPG